MTALTKTVVKNKIIKTLSPRCSTIPKPDIYDSFDSGKGNSLSLPLYTLHSTLYTRVSCIFLLQIKIMRRKQACRGRGRPRKKPNVVSERVVSERMVNEKLVNEKEVAFLNFVSQNVEEGNDIGWNQSDNEDHNDEEFDPEMEIDSGNSSSSSMGSDWLYGDQNVSSMDRTVQRLLRSMVK
ncbi:hypothetical protein GBA52_023824 [Prunus armeniaca]|nr:hypothetical protein GBA52_023824 [Prunus armeniaca]